MLEKYGIGVFSNLNLFPNFDKSDENDDDSCDLDKKKFFKKKWLLQIKIKKPFHISFWNRGYHGPISIKGLCEEYQKTTEKVAKYEK